MIVLDYKVGATRCQEASIDEAIRTSQFVQNVCLRLWMDAKESDTKVGKYDIYKYTTKLRHDFDWCGRLGSTAVQAAGERAWAAISRFYGRVKHGEKPVGYPKFKRNTRSVEYKQSGWKLDRYGKKITFTDGNNIGTMKMKGTWDILSYGREQIKRVRLLRRADGYYVQFVVDVDRALEIPPTGNTIGLDVGLSSFYMDSNGNSVENPRFYRKAEKKLGRLQRRVSSKKKGSSNRRKAINKLGRAHLKVSRQRKDFATKTARCVAASNDLIAYEDLKVRNMKRNRNLAKSISDAGWREFRGKLEYYGKVFGRVTVAVPPHHTSQKCSACGVVVKKALSERVHRCECGTVLDRDHNAAINILKAGLSTVGHTGTYAWGDDVRPLPSAEAIVDEPRISGLSRVDCQSFIGRKNNDSQS